MAQRGFDIAVKRASRQRSFKVRPLSHSRPMGGAVTADSSFNNLLVWFLSAGSVVYGAVAIAVFGWLAFGAFDIKISGDSFRSSIGRLSLSSSSDKDEFLRRMNFEHKRDLTTQINYVSNIIKRSARRIDDAEASALSKSIVLEARSQNLDPLFVAAIIKSESTFKHTAVSHVGATGLMQIMPDTGKWISSRAALNWRGTHTLQDPVSNLRLGIAYIKELNANFRGNTEHALIAYNWGPANLSRALKDRSHIPTSTKQYARTIIRDHKRWSADYAAQMAQFRYMNRTVS